MSKKKKKSPWAVLIAIVLAIFAGTLSGKEAGLFGVTFYSIYEVLGTLFINALTLVVVPLVTSSIITGVARIGSESDFGRVGLKTFGFYLITSFLAIFIGLFFVNIIGPGYAIDTEATQLIESSKLMALREEFGSGEVGHIAKLLLEIVPPNIVDAFSKGNMLGLIFFSLLFGYAITRIVKKESATLMSFFKGTFETMIEITHMIMRLLPLGVFCLVAKVFAETGLQSLRSVGLFFLTVMLGLATFTFVGLPLLLRFIAKVNPVNQFRAMTPALITAFSTSSSSASIPITLDCMEKRGGISNRICSLVIPLGTTVNLSGSALFEGMAAMFVAQAYGLEISILSQIAFLFITLLTSLGVAGVPSGSLVAILIILKAMGLPSEGIGLFLAVDRILDMCRTTVNVFSDSCCATLVAATEGEKNILTKTVFDD